MTYKLEAWAMVRRKVLVVTAILIAALCATNARRDILIGVAAPMTGATNAWSGEQVEHGAALAVADINAAGGVLGQQVRLITVDDYCDPEQAVAAAKKLVSEGVVFVVGHFCSHSSIPASEVYEKAGVLMMSPGSSNPMLTELGRANVFRFLHRDDALGIVAAKYIAEHWPDKKIAILHDNTVFGMARDRAALPRAGRLVPYARPGALADVAATGMRDIGLIAAEPARAELSARAIS